MGKKRLSEQKDYHWILNAWEQEQVEQKYQDTIFSLLYSDPECALDLYLTLHPEDRDAGITSDQIKIITIKKAAFLIRRYNDVAFQVGNKLIVLVEHQSTINQNMPLRMLFYIVREYEKVIDSIKEKLYKETMIRIPRPEFYIVYTGEKEWRQKELKLSEAYGAVNSKEIPLELKVRVIHEEEMRGAQNTLGSYYDYTAFIKANRVDGKICIEAVENYIREFTGSELFKRFLENLRAEEVVKMENYEIDKELVLKFLAEEAMEEGMEKGMEKGLEQGLEQGIRSLMKTMKLNLDQAMDALSIPAEEQPMYAARIRQQPPLVEE